MGANLYLVGLDYETQNIISDAEPCHICKRMIINAGIKKVFIMATEKEFRQIEVKKWINSNLGEIKKIKGKWTFVMPEGYGYHS